MSQYRNRTPIPLAVDCIIFGFHDGNLELLLVHREIEPDIGKPSLMGGFVEPEEDLSKAAERVLHKLTGLQHGYLEQVMAFGDVGRDSVERVVSIVYYALIRKEQYDQELVKKHNAKWYPLNELPDMMFDHKDMVSIALERLRLKVKTEPLGFNLLPPKFTQSQIQELYEAILGEELDKRNFRKKLTSMEFLVKLDEKDKTGSKRGAFLYEFDQEKYRSLSKQGFGFKV